MNSEMHVKIPQDCMLPSTRNILGRHFHFQHDNDLKHTSKKTTKFLKQKKVKVLVWPPQSPHLNNIEHLWEETERRQQDKNPRNCQELKDVLQRVWDEIVSQVCYNMFDSMPRRLQAIIAAKGGPTKY